MYSRPWKILLVEDNPGDAGLICEALRGRVRFELASVDRLATALSELARAPRDVVLLDLGLPDSQGLATLDVMRAHHPKTPIVVLTGSDDDELAVASLQRGAQDYLVKGHMEGPLLVRALVYAIERSRADARTKASETSTQAIMETALDAIVSMDRAGRITEFNRAAERTFGHSRIDVIGRSLAEVLVPPSLREAHGAGLERYLVSGVGPMIGKRVEVSAIRKDGVEIPVELAVARVGDDEPARFTAFIRDISARKLAEQALLECEGRFRSLADSGLIGIVVADREGRILDVNDAYLRLVGYTHAELVDGTLRWEDLTAPAFRHLTALATVQLETQGVARPWETEILRKDGSSVSMLIGIAMLDASRRIAVTTDLTDCKRFEAALRKSDVMLRQAQKMEAVGRLAGGVAHDFNNMLSVILSYSTLMLEDLGVDDAMRADLEEIRTAGQRAADLTRQLLIFSRQQVVELKNLDLNDVLSRMGKMLTRIVGEDVDLVFLTGPSLGLVSADPSNIDQVIMNLVVNARDAMPTGGKLTVETVNVELDADHVRPYPGMRPGPHVMLAVSDTGIGMDAATQARIFEPFFTTKTMDKGTGLGLSTVFGIAQQSGGGIWVYSEPGKGSTLKVYFPRVDGEPAPIRRPLAPVAIGGSETILLIEDDDQVRLVTRGILRRQGYHVIEAGNADEAIGCSEHFPGPIHLLLTDVVMPQMSGPEVAKLLAVQRPDMKVVCMSGYTDDSVVRHGVLASGVAYLQKPITPDSLTRKVREALDARA